MDQSGAWKAISTSTRWSANNHARLGSSATAETRLLKRKRARLVVSGTIFEQRAWMELTTDVVACAPRPGAVRQMARVSIQTGRPT
jgi:hypothetical protein